jgi:hypothetical protein
LIAAAPGRAGLLLLGYGALVPFRPGLDTGRPPPSSRSSPDSGSRAASRPVTILGAAETYLLITRLTNWDLDAYQDWLATTAARLARVTERHSDRLGMRPDLGL